MHVLVDGDAGRDDPVVADAGVELGGVGEAGVGEGVANHAQRNVGITSSERHLERLATRSFLSLWTYPGLYRGQA